MIEQFPFNNKYEVNKVEVGGRRHYICPNGSYPSITTVLSATEDQQYLQQWRERVGEAEANRISLEATTKGTGLHSLCENYIAGKEINPTCDIAPASRVMFNHLVNPIDKHLNGYWALEAGVYSDFLRTAGQSDLVGVWKSVPSVVDFKSNHKPDNKKEEHIFDYKVQVAFYATAWNEMYPELPKIEQGVLLIASMFHRQIFEFDAMEGYKELLRRRRLYYSQNNG